MWNVKPNLIPANEVATEYGEFTIIMFKFLEGGIYCLQDYSYATSDWTVKQSKKARHSFILWFHSISCFKVEHDVRILIYYPHVESGWETSWSDLLNDIVGEFRGCLSYLQDIFLEFIIPMKCRLKWWQELAILWYAQKLRSNHEVPTRCRWSNRGISTTLSNQNKCLARLLY